MSIESLLQETKVDAFFAELEKMATGQPLLKRLATMKAHPFYTAGRGAAVGAALGGGSKALGSYSDEKLQQAKDDQQKLTPEEKKKAKRSRIIGHTVGSGLATATGAGVGGVVGKANEFGRKLGKKVEEGSATLTERALKKAGPIAEAKAKEMADKIIEHASGTVTEKSKKIADELIDHAHGKAMGKVDETVKKVEPVVRQASRKAARGLGRATGFSKAKTRFKLIGRSIRKAVKGEHFKEGLRRAAKEGIKLGSSGSH